MERSKLLKSVLQLLVLMLFVLVTSATLFYAFGYKYDRDKLRVVATGILRVPQYLDQASLYLDGELVANDLPVDLQYVLPGQYSLEIKRPGFHVWSKKIEVSSGKITEVGSVLLVPEKIDFNRKFVKRVSDSPFQTFVGRNYLGDFDSNGLLVLAYIDANGGVVRREFDLGFDEEREIYPLISGKLLLRLGEGKFNYFNIKKSDLTEGFELPGGAHNIRVIDGKGFYLRNEILFAFDLPPLSSEGEYSQVVGDFYFRDLKGFEVLDLERGFYFFEYLNGDRVFGRLDAEKQILKTVDTAISGVPRISHDGNWVLYQKGSELWLYDVLTDKKEFLTRFSVSLEDVQWHPDSNHLVFIDGESLKICNIGFENCYVLSTVDKGSRLYFIDESQRLIFRKDGNFYSLDLSFV